VKLTYPRCATLLALITIVLIGCLLGYVIRGLKDAREMVQIKERVHILSVVLQQYVTDHGGFPKNLNALTNGGILDPRLLQPLGGEKIEYFSPPTNAPDDFAVLVVTVHTNRIMVDKTLRMHP
jgi:hypothetical protein